MTPEGTNNIILKTMARIQINSLIVEIESLTPEQLQNRTILEAYKDSLTKALSYFEFNVLSDLNNEKQTQLSNIREKLQTRILSLELQEMRKNTPPVIVRKESSTLKYKF